jgi:vancomycin permeability regulator SanA
MGQMQQMMSAFQRFKAEFKGDPQQEVQKLLNSGQMTQQQYNQLQQMANQMAHMMSR